MRFIAFKIWFITFKGFRNNLLKRHWKVCTKNASCTSWGKELHRLGTAAEKAFPSVLICVPWALVYVPLKVQFPSASYSSLWDGHSVSTDSYRFIQVNIFLQVLWAQVINYYKSQELHFELDLKTNLKSVQLLYYWFYLLTVATLLTFWPLHFVPVEVAK